MKARFIGDPAEGDNATIPKVITVHGVAFPNGKFVDVPDGLASKFEGNSHFETQGKAGKEDVAAPAVVNPNAVLQQQSAAAAEEKK